MVRLNKKEYEREMARAKMDNVYKQRNLALQKERNRFSKKKLETNKLMAFYLFILLNAIIIYAMIAMWVFRDLAYLGVLISDIAGQVLIYAIYCVKAYCGKKQEENLKFEKEKFSLSNVLNNDEEIGG